MNLYWVGMRESEIINTKNLFEGTICVYRKDGLIKSLRINHNEDKNWEMIDNYFYTTKQKILKQNPNAKFMHYDYVGMNQKDLTNCICYNDLELLEKLNNKFFTKRFFKNIVPVLDFEIIKGKNINIYKIKKKYGNCIVLQEKEGSGGENTKIVNLENNDKFDLNKEYILSSYCKKNMSINIHLLIGKEKVTLFPPSVQIIKNIDNYMIYVGCDYIKYNEISEEIVKKHKSYSLKIGKELQKMGYRGICGIDSIIYNNEIYFMEINPRFQSSTTILNKALLEQNFPSVQYMQLRCFEGEEFESIDIPVNYSCCMNLAGVKNTVSLKPIEIYDLDEREIPEEKQAYKSSYVYNKSIYKYIKEN